MDIAGENTPIVLAHISNVFASTESDLVTVDGLFQISDSYNSVEEGDKYGKMEVTQVSDDESRWRTKIHSLSGEEALSRSSEMLDSWLQIADVLRFAPVVERTGVYDVRGTVIDPSETGEFTWTPYNFEGFYYDIDDDVGTEKLEVTISGGTKINEDDLVYTTSPQPGGVRV